MKTRTKSYALGIIAALFIPGIATLIFNIYIDPFQVIHKDFYRPSTFLPTMYARYQQAGIINQYDIESAVIGHSEDANFFPSSLQNTLGWKNTFNLSINGRTLFEQAIVAKRVFYKNDIINVLWGFGIRNLLVQWDAPGGKAPLDTYLYDNNRLNDLGFYMSSAMLKYHKMKISVPSNTATGDEDILNSRKIDRIASWYKGKQICRFNRPGFIAKKIIGRKIQTPEDETLTGIPTKQLFAPLNRKSTYSQAYRDNFSKNIEPLIIEHPSTNFYFVITAYPTLKARVLKSRNSEKYLSGLRTLKQFVTDTQQYRNVKVFAYGLEAFTDDLRLYKDPGHYHPEVNNYIIEQIGEGKGVLTVDNIDEYLLAFDQKVTNYRLPKKWILSSGRSVKQTGYLSAEVARLLIQNNPNGYSDREIYSMALAKGRLPACAKRLI